MQYRLITCVKVIQSSAASGSGIRPTSAWDAADEDDEEREAEVKDEPTDEDEEEAMEVIYH